MTKNEAFFYFIKEIALDKKEDPVMALNNLKLSIKKSQSVVARHDDNKGEVNKFLF